MNLYLQSWKKFVDFSGRATRPEYWVFVLINYLVMVVLVIGGMMADGDFSNISEPQTDPTFSTWEFLYGILSLLVFLPTLAVGARRLHDSGRSGFWLLMSFIPIIGGITLIIFMLQGSQQFDNQYGPYGQVESEIFD